MIAQRLSRLPNPDAVADPMSGSASSSEKESPRRSLADKLLGKAKALVRQYPWKVDFDQCTGKQLIAGLRRVEARYGHPDGPLPFVLIGHSKTFTSHNERSLRPFLEFVAANPDRFSFGTFADFEAERYRASVAA